MKSLSSYTQNIKSQNNKGLVAYITAGLPGWIDTIHQAHQSGADIVEVGLPFSDPVMDGPIIAHASSIALDNGAKTLDLLNQLSEESFIKPIVIMTYTNVLYVHGVTNIVPILQESNVTGLILPDLTFEQSSLFSCELTNTDISLIQLVSSTTKQKRLENICKTSEGFIYCVAIKGITGDRVNIADNYGGFISEVQKLSSTPTYCGVGIRTPVDAKSLANLSDGVIVGTTFVQYMLDNPGEITGLGKLISSFRSTIDS